MTKEREALKLALEALLESKPFLNDLDSRINHITAITSVKEALAQPEQKYTTTRNAWTGKATYKCNICGRDDFRSEHAAAFHECGEKAQPEQEPVAWNVINPSGEIVATESNAIRGWARIQGYKPTVEGLLGFHERGWRVVPATTPLQRKPLLTSDIVTMYDESPRSDNEMIEFARAIEAAHGIKE